MRDFASPIERVRSGSGADRELDGDIAEALGVFVEGWNRTGAFEWANMLGEKVGAPAYTSSLDAVVRLVEEKLPGWTWDIHSMGNAWLWKPGNAASGADYGYPDDPDADPFLTPIRALLLVLLTALQAQESGTT